MDPLFCFPCTKSCWRWRGPLILMNQVLIRGAHKQRGIHVNHSWNRGMQFSRSGKSRPPETHLSYKSEHKKFNRLTCDNEEEKFISSYLGSREPGHVSRPDHVHHLRLHVAVGAALHIVIRPWHYQQHARFHQVQELGVHPPHHLPRCPPRRRPEVEIRRRSVHPLRLRSLGSGCANWSQLHPRHRNFAPKTSAAAERTGPQGRRGRHRHRHLHTHATATAKAKQARTTTSLLLSFCLPRVCLVYNPRRHRIFMITIQNCIYVLVAIHNRIVCSCGEHR